VPFLSAVILARDEARSIARCIDSLRPHVDEVLVLDTGSVDDTVAIASAHGARVEHFAWVDDFAAARNHALALAEGEWRLVVDADEWLAEGAADLAPLRTGAARRFIGVVAQDNAQSTGQRTTTWLPRLLPRDVTYTGRVHEQPQLLHVTRRTGIRLAHDGYLRGQLDRKAGRNQALLEAALADDPTDVYLRYQLGKEHEVYHRYVEGAREYDAAYAATPVDASWRHDLVVRYLHTLAQAGRSADALDVADVELAHWQHSADFFFVVGEVLLTYASEHPARAVQLLALADDAWSRCLELGDTLELEGAVAGRGSHLAAHNLKVIRGEIG
jgi:glycosyltransferase involved in cell wall biosynthesis